MQLNRISSFYLVVLFGWAIVITSTKAQDTSKKAKVDARFKVYGNCGACEERITEALDQKGIVAGGWDREKQEVWVVYRPSKVTLEQIHRYIAAVGHDTDLMKADSAVYQSLPNCCLYREKHSPH
jgi:Cu(I)/Ag(I) efflux system membrane fusion protein